MSFTGVSTDDILEDIRKRLKEANEKLKDDAENGILPPELMGDYINLSEQDNNENAINDEVFDEVILEQKNPEEARKTMLDNLNEVRQNLEEGLDDNLEILNFTRKNIKDTLDKEGFEFEESFYDENPAKEDFTQENSIKEQDNLEEYEEEDEVFEEDYKADHQNANPYTYEEHKISSISKIPNYSGHEISFEENFASSLTQKIANILDEKLGQLSKKQIEKKDDTKLEDLISASLPNILEKWLDKNQALVLNIIEDVAQKHILQAISKIKK